MQPAASIKPGEIEKFDALAARWWDAAGPMRPLHMMNAARAGWILERIAARFGDVAGVDVLDVGCGAGLLAETLAKADCDVLGVDAASEAVAAAERHARGKGLTVNYRAGSAEALLEEGRRFSVITALEIIEHVAAPLEFIGTLAGLLAPGGRLFVSTLNRTRKSYVMAKIGAEYVLRLLPVGTHDWKRFVTPAELGGMCRHHGLSLADMAGMSFSPAAGRFRISRDMDVNYIAMARGRD